MAWTAASTAVALLCAAISLLILLKEGRQGRGWLALGLLLLAFVEALDSRSLLSLDRLVLYKRVVLGVQSLLPATFLAYGLSFLRRTAGVSRLPALLPLLAITAAFAAGAATLPAGQLYEGIDAETGRVLALGTLGYWYYLGLMLLCVAALVNLESVFAGLRGADRWRVKFEFLGVGAILAVLVFYFSQGLLYRAVNMGLLPVRTGVVAAGALLVGFSRLYRGRTAGIAVSRQALYRSFTLVAVGVYLLALGLIGEGMRRLDVPVTENVSILVAVLSGLAFLALLLSDEIRRRLRILIAKHFYAQKHDYREEWLGLSDALAGCRSLGEVRAAIVERYTQVFAPRFAVLYIREGDSGSFLAAAAPGGGGPPERVALTAGLLGYFAETGRVLNPADGEYSPSPEEAAFLRAAEAWLVVPLMAGGRLEAFVVLGRQIVPERLTYEDFDLMKIIGRQAALALGNLRLTEELAEAREMAAVAKVSAFVIHDLKNLAYTFSLMMENAEGNIGEPEFQRDLVRSIRATVAKMNGLIGKLRAFPAKTELHPESTDLAVLAEQTIAEIAALKPGLPLEAHLQSAAIRADAEEIRKVILNLVLNAADAVRDGGGIAVRTGLRGGEATLSVEDRGVGMSADFVANHLFHPFRTTKEKGLGIGLYQCRQIAEAHGGRIEVESREGEGSVFTLVLAGDGGR